METEKERNMRKIQEAWQRVRDAQEKARDAQHEAEAALGEWNSLKATLHTIELNE